MLDIIKSDTCLQIIEKPTGAPNDNCYISDNTPSYV